MMMMMIVGVDCNTKCKIRMRVSRDERYIVGRRIKNGCRRKWDILLSFTVYRKDQNYFPEKF